MGIARRIGLSRRGGVGLSRRGVGLSRRQGIGLSRRRDTRLIGYRQLTRRHTNFSSTNDSFSNPTEPLRIHCIGAGPCTRRAFGSGITVPRFSGGGFDWVRRGRRLFSRTSRASRRQPGGTLTLLRTTFSCFVTHRAAAAELYLNKWSKRHLLEAHLTIGPAEI